MRDRKSIDLEKFPEDVKHMKGRKCKQFLRSIYISTSAKIMVSIIIMEKSRVFTISAITVAVLLGILIVQMPAMTLAGSSSLAAASPSPLNTIFKQVENSVVQITSKVPIPSNNPQNPQAPNATALGSGFVYDKLGRIITNNHVVGNAKIVDVTFVDGNRYTAKVVGSDIYSDIAVLQVIENITQQPLNPLVIGNSSKLEVGDPVIAIGHPFGLDNTMTAGIIGQTRYLLSIPELGVFTPDVIQTDAAINPGNSGGPLLDMQGQVIGINIGRIGPVGSPGPYPGLTVAVPFSTITRIVPTLIEKGIYVHPYIGLSGATLTSDLAETINGLPRNFKGILVNSIVKDGPADKAGVQASTIDKYSKTHGGDVITAIDGHAVVRIEDLISYIEEHKFVGNSMTLTIYRNGQMLDLKATLQGRPSPFQYIQK
jgi:S1-C subfamily serine protease